MHPATTTLTRQQRNVLDLLKTSPDVARLSAEAIEGQKQARARLLAEIESEKKRLAPQAAKKHKDLNAAVAARQAAEMRWKEALAAEASAFGAAYGASNELNNAVSSRTMELQRSADPRIKDALWWIDDLVEQVRLSYRLWPGFDRSWTGKKIPTVQSNDHEISVCQAILANVRARVMALSTAVEGASCGTELRALCSEATEAANTVGVRPDPINLDD